MVNTPDFLPNGLGLMNLKLISLTAALAAAATSANAADLNRPAKVAVDYVKVCDAYGAGFFYIPGSDTCLRIGGYVYVNIEGGTANTVRNGTLGGVYTQGQRGFNGWSSYSRGALTFDARTNTQYGLLRSVIAYNVNVGSSATNSAVTTVRLDNAFVQLGGLTAGRTQTAFGFYSSDVFDSEYGQISNSVNVNQLAYTASFGNGVTATLSLEDPTTGDNLNTAATNGSAVFRRAGYTFSYGALNAPDVVANLDVTQAWGEARLGVAAHQVYGGPASPATKWGYAVEGTILANVPQLGEGDKIGLTAAFAQGANAYVNAAGQYPGAFYLGSGKSDLDADATYSPATGLNLTRSWSVFGGITHNFTPNFEFNGAAGYQSVSNGGTGVAGIAGGPAANGFNVGQFEFAAQLKWKPVKAFYIAPYVEFRNANFSSGTMNNYGLMTKNATAVDFAVRLRRDF